MRTSDRIYFVTKGDEIYNSETSEFEQEEIKTLKPCHISDLGIDRSKELFGDYVNSRKVVRFNQPITLPFDGLEYRGLPYRLLSARLNNTVLYIERGGD